jgi:hypothetical protein
MSWTAARFRVLAGEFVAQPLEVDRAQVDGEPFSLVPAVRAALAASISALILAVVAVRGRVLRQRLPEAPEDAVVVDDDAAYFAGIHAVGPGDGLHQVVRPHRLVDVERRQALDIEARQPHRADNCHPERVVRVLERSVVGIHGRRQRALRLGKFGAYLVEFRLPAP